MHRRNFSIKDLTKIASILRPDVFTLSELIIASQLTESSCKSILNFLQENGIGETVKKDVIQIKTEDKVKIATILCSLGEPSDEASKTLDWKEFETFSLSILENHGYTLHQNVRLRNPKMEIDLVAHRENVAIVVDCKHWRKSISSSVMNQIVESQIIRTKNLINKGSNYLGSAMKIIPTILTLYGGATPFFAGVPIVPIQKFSDYLLGVQGYLDDILVLDSSEEKEIPPNESS